jgi:hypothetical protein
VIGVHESRPAADAVVPMVLTRPYHLVATPRTDAEIRLAPR